MVGDTDSRDKTIALQEGARPANPSGTQKTRFGKRPLQGISGFGGCW
jgi:hypothetical protein